MMKKSIRIRLLLIALVSLLSLFSLQQSNSIHASETANTNQTMNLKQIKKGNYTSLKGKWELVGLAYNTYGAHNQYGINWQKITKSTIRQHRLKITQHKIKAGGETFKKKSLKLKYGPKLKLKFRHMNNHLIAEADNGIYYSCEFYPKNVHFESKVGGNLPRKIVDGKEKIVLFSSNLGGVWVYQRK